MTFETLCYSIKHICDWIQTALRLATSSHRLRKMVFATLIWHRGHCQWIDLLMLTN